MRGEFLRVGGRGVAVGGEDSQVGVDASETLGDLLAIVSAHDDGERELLPRSLARHGSTV